MSLNVGSYKFLAESSQMDFADRLMLNHLGNQLLNAAGIHAEECGFGMNFLNKNHYTWVLSRLALECSEYPTQNEWFYIDTWLENVMNFFSKRNFIIRNMNGKIIGYARSVWSMIDMSSRNPVNLANLGDGIIYDYLAAEQECPIDGPSKINIKAKTPVQSSSVQYTDVDINGHCNSMHYIERMLNLISIDLLKTRRIKRFEISYHSEALYGDLLDNYYELDISDNKHLFEIRKHLTNEVTCKAKFFFGEIE